MALSYYEILGVAPTASSDEIKAAYRKVAALYHPDRSDGLSNDALMAEATEAKDTLLDPGKRRLYNQYLGSEATPRFEPPNQNLHSESAPTHSASHRDGPDGWAEDDFEPAPLRPRMKRSGKLLTIAILFAVFTYYDWAHSVPGLTGVPYRDALLVLVVIWGLFWVTPKRIVDRGFNFVCSLVKHPKSKVEAEK